MSIPADKLELYNAVIAAFGKLERKGKTTPYTSHNGHMTSFLDKSGIMGLRLSSEDIDAFISEHDSKLMEQHGRIMKDFVLIPDSLLANQKSMLTYIEKSYEHTASLKPKPTKKK
ncbi:MAG: hypothetical protein ACPGD8_03300 [Flavobacteriales bacterium]